MIGYLIEQELENRLPGKLIATLLTQVRVDPKDPAFGKPTKPIGPVYDEPLARKLAGERGWQIARDETKWRRVVASPEPITILDEGHLAAGRPRRGGYLRRGGIPVVARAEGKAVIDKDRASALLATQLAPTC